MPRRNAALASNKHGGSASPATAKATARSRVTNGAEVLPGIDGRSLLARRYRDILAAICSDQGGSDRMAEARMQLARRFAALAVQAEQMEAAMARGETLDVGEYSQLVSTLVRVATRLGINRTARDITPTIRDLIESHARQQV